MNLLFILTPSWQDNTYGSAPLCDSVGDTHQKKKKAPMENVNRLAWEPTAMPGSDCSLSHIGLHVSLHLPLSST